MADHVPPFLQAIELDVDADERAIRRAYAKRLKRIDPETDPEAFQALREVFEAALAWVAQPKGMRLVRVTRYAPGEGPPSLRELLARAKPPAPPPPSSSDTVPSIEIPASATGSFSWDMDDAKDAPAAPTPSSADNAATARKAEPAPAREPAPADARDTSPRRTKAPDADTLPPPAHRASTARPPRIATPAPARAPSGAARLSSKPPLDMAPQEDPADLVYADFVDRFTRTASGEPDVARLLREALADARLVNLEARTRFEGRVADLLAGGWRPGHEWLFQPACDAFEWEADRRRLDAFGRAGNLLDAAVRERLIFFAQPAVAFEAQKSLIRRLRSERPASARELAPEMARLAMLMQRFPAWMGVMTRKEIVQHWFDAWNAMPEAERAAARDLAPAPAPARAPMPALARAAAPVPARAGTRATSAATRPSPRTAAVPALPPVQAYASRSRGSLFDGLNSGSMRWLAAAFIAGALRLFGGSHSTSHSEPAPPPPPPIEVIAAPEQAPPTPADTIRALAGQPQSSSYDAPGADAARDPVEQARQDALARRQAQIDDRYQEAVRVRQAKRAIRAGAPQGDVQVIPLPDSN